MTQNMREATQRIISLIEKGQEPIKDLQGEVDALNAQIESLIQENTSLTLKNVKLFGALQSARDYGSSAWEDWLVDKVDKVINKTCATAEDQSIDFAGIVNITEFQSVCALGYAWYDCFEDLDKSSFGHVFKASNVSEFAKTFKQFMRDVDSMYYNFLIDVEPACFFTAGDLSVTAMGKHLEVGLKSKVDESFSRYSAEAWGRYLLEVTSGVTTLYPAYTLGYKDGNANEFSLLSSGKITYLGDLGGCTERVLPIIESHNEGEVFARIDMGVLEENIDTIKTQIESLLENLVRKAT